MFTNVHDVSLSVHSNELSKIRSFCLAHRNIMLFFSQSYCVHNRTSFVRLGRPKDVKLSRIQASCTSNAKMQRFVGIVEIDDYPDSASAGTQKSCLRMKELEPVKPWHQPEPNPAQCIMWNTSTQLSWKAVVEICMQRKKVKVCCLVLGQAYSYDFTQ